jgi:RHS repeat-associated protein
VFILSGAEDLVPAFKRNPDGSLVLDKQGNPVSDEEPRDGYTIKRYRPRIEGLFARIERWTRLSDGDTHWRSISRDNVLTVYGSTLESRIADPANTGTVFSWLICQSYDDIGNAITYNYASENGDNVDLSHINERNRVRSANRYLKTVRHGNRQPFLIDPTLPSFRQQHIPEPDFSSANWMFEVVFDYGEGHYQEAAPNADGRIFATASLKPPANGSWPVRVDPYSTYRSCFELRCYRLCRRVLVFHHFPAELGVDDCLVSSTEFTYLEKPNGSFISQVMQSGFKRIPSSTPPYLRRSLPPLEFEYSLSPLDDLTFDQLALEELDSASLENLPAGIDLKNYRWVDLDGEGISGVLTEYSGGWYYKPNLGDGHFGPVERLSPLPSLAALRTGPQQLLDVAGDGNLDLVDFSIGTRGFFPRNDDASWDLFRPFAMLPDINWKDANLRFVDLTGDGLADVMLTEDQAFSTWFESCAEQGFGVANHITNPLDEENGPRLVFADGTQSIYLADMSGDGLSDLVRVRNGEVSYWPNIGYGRFGAKVTLNNVPWFDDAESFDQSRVRLADTDGSGPTDILYLGLDGVRVYLNQHGNSLSDARLLDRVPRVDDHTSISVVDFRGHGTACLLWSSELPSDAPRSVRYLDLMGGIKPHLLTLVRNNLGAETRIEYESSTEFYLADKAAGTPWITRLPFPVHVVTRVETNDLISGNRFATTYTYHHGYFDGVEREFRGFGRVEQLDTEEFGVVPQGTNQGKAFHVPPVLTKTWFHTGAFLAGERISRQFEEEYYREDLSEAQAQSLLLADTVLPPGLADMERREAVRSLKGGILRQEIYALDNKPESGRPYSVSERNYAINSVQPRGPNLHCIFFTHARETVDYHYERALFPVLGSKIVDPAVNPDAVLLADPRVSHTVNLSVDDYGNVLQSVSIGYGRRFDDSDPILTPGDRKKQRQLLATLTESSFTNAEIASDAYRAPLVAEISTYELVKLNPKANQPATTNLYVFDDLVSTVSQAGDGLHDLPFEDVSAAGATGTSPYRRLIERVRNRYRANNLSQLLVFNKLQLLALKGESYKLTFTPGLLSTVFQRSSANQLTENLLPNPSAVLLSDAASWADRGGYVDLDGDGNWWIPSGRVFYHPDPNATPANELVEAVNHFFVQRSFRDPFGQRTLVEYEDDLLPSKTIDAQGNIVQVVNDFRVLHPKQLTEPNGNRSFLAFDSFGLPVATALAGKLGETVGDSLDGFEDFDADPELTQLQAFAAGPLGAAAGLLKNASTRFVYDLDRYRRCGEPPFAAVLARETHASDPVPADGLRIRVSFTYSDGYGREIQSKIPAEPGDAALRGPNIAVAGGDIKPGPLTLGSSGNPALGNANPRWVGKGRTLYNNKGNPVRQYEPFFSSTQLYEPEPEMTETGVTPTLFYDPLNRVVATLHPNHTYEKVVFDPWWQETWDVNDTVTQLDPKTDADVGDFFQLLPAADYLPVWYDQRRNGQKGTDEKSAAEKAAAHAGTPAVAHFDTLGRAIVTIADNGLDDNGVAQKYSTRVTLDIEGNHRVVFDAKSRVVMRYDYDLLGNRISQASMEAGQRWMLSDVSGKPIRSWDSRGHAFRTAYDELRRKVQSYAIGADPDKPTLETCFEVLVYGESPSAGLTLAQAAAANLRGKIYRHYDTAGLSTTASYDFKGNPLASTRQLVQDYKTPPDWSKSPSLEVESFASSTSYDALDRPVQLVAPHSDIAGTKINVLQHGYNEANLLESVDVWLARASGPAGLLDPTSASLHAVTNFDYNAKGQRTRVDYGNGSFTEYSYDELTFRLIRLKTNRSSTANPGVLGRLLGRAGVTSTTVFQDLTYTYDPAGNITHIRDDAQQTIYFNGQVVLPEFDYGYDPIYRLTRATGREHVGQLAEPQTSWNDEFRINLPHPNDGSAMRNYGEQYFYDPVGNFDRLVHQAAGGNWTRTYTYNETSLLESSKKSNRLSSTAVGSTTEPYTYDANGNMVAMPHLTLMQWDFRDQLGATSRQFVNPAPPPANTAETTYYVYDSAGQRTRKVTDREGGSRKEERIYFGGFEMYRQCAANGTSINLERETLHVMDDKQRIALVETRTRGSDGSPVQLIRFQFGNHLGTAALELDDQSTIISYEEYYPYGSTAYQAVDQNIKAAAKRYRYTSKERDSETGFYYHGARYYAPWLGRWSSSDPIGIADGTNTYSYAGGTPVCHLDPHGLAGSDPADPNTHQFWLEGVPPSSNNSSPPPPAPATPTAAAPAAPTSKGEKQLYLSESKGHDFEVKAAGKSRGFSKQHRAYGKEVVRLWGGPKRYDLSHVGKPHVATKQGEQYRAGVRERTSNRSQSANERAAGGARSGAKGADPEAVPGARNVQPKPPEIQSVSPKPLQVAEPPAAPPPAANPAVESPTTTPVAEPSTAATPVAESPTAPVGAAPKPEGLAPKGTRGAGVAKAAGVIGMVLLARDLYKAKNNEQREQIVENAVVGVAATSAVARIPVAGPWIAAGATGLGLGIGIGTALAEDVIPDRAQQAYGKVISEKAFGTKNQDDIEILEKVEVFGLRPFAP